MNEKTILIKATETSFDFWRYLAVKLNFDPIKTKEVLIYTEKFLVNKYSPLESYAWKEADED